MRETTCRAGPVRKSRPALMIPELIVLGLALLLLVCDVPLKRARNAF